MNKISKNQFCVEKNEILNFEKFIGNKTFFSKFTQILIKSLFFYHIGSLTRILSFL